MKKTILLLAVITLFGAGCISFSSGPAGIDGGVFKSVNRGEEWTQKANLYTSAGIKSFSGADVITFAMDPQDHLAVYAGTPGSGMFYSYDGGESWRQPKDVASGFVSAIAVDPNNKCVIYAATMNRILKSMDCNRTFKEIHRESAGASYVTALAINPHNSSTLYAGTVQGRLIKSVDAGKTWVLEHQFPNKKIISIISDSQNPLTRFVVLLGRGIWKTQNGGVAFEELSEPLKPFQRGFDTRHFVADRGNPNILLLATKNKILRSADGGAKWEELPIISPEDVELLALAVNPRDSKEIYYGTATTFYKSSDGGQSWSTKKLPTSRTATAILVDAENKDTIYLGVTKVKK